LSLYGSSVEYGLHCLLTLIDDGSHRTVSSADLARFQGMSPTYVAKLLSQLKNAGLVSSTEGIHGGYRLARSPETITVLEVIDALEGDKRLFNCTEIRNECAMFDGSPPAWASKGVCSIHAVMLEAENEMRKTLRKHTLVDIAKRFEAKAPQIFFAQMGAWFTAARQPRTGVGKSASAINWVTKTKRAPK
jgi:Rrf2 family protein